VVECNTTLKVADTEKLVHQAVDSVPDLVWVDCFWHAEALQDKDFKRDMVANSALEPIIFNLEVCVLLKSDTESSDKDDDSDT
jgi:hypothetical protein